MLHLSSPVGQTGNLPATEQKTPIYRNISLKI